MISKIGVDGTFSEGAIVHHSAGPKMLRYVAAVIGAPDFVVLGQAFVKIDSIIAARS